MHGLKQTALPGARAANKQLAAAQQLVALPVGRLKPLLPDLDERITDAVFLARNMKRSKARLLRIVTVSSPASVLHSS